jgi:cyclophilin family peptidyl-prolyl cis-trans isomerase
MTTRRANALVIVALLGPALLAPAVFARQAAPATQAAQPAQRSMTFPDGLYAELQTNKGLIVLQLEFEKTPMTVANFVGLAEGTIENKALPLGKPFFDGSVWHRVVAGHVIQAGMPKATERGPGYTIPNEIVAGLNHGRDGMLGMANSGPHTNSSQFYITLADRSYLDGIYTVFGHVVAGLDIVHKIVQGDVIEQARIVRVGAKAAAFKADNATFVTLVETAKAAVKAADAEKAAKEDSIIAKEWPGARTSPKGARFVVQRAGTGEPAQAGQKIRATYAGRYLLDGRPICSSPEEGRPVPGTSAQPFDFVAGTTRVNPGIEEALLDMRAGEKRTVIVQGAAGYGTSGYFSKEKPGEKRFVIPPNTSLVYELEVLSIVR